MSKIKKMRKIFFLCILIIFACEDRIVNENTKDSFGFYLTRDEVPPYLLEAHSYIAPADKPLISLDEIVSYTWSDHTIVLTEKGRQILDTLSMGVYGRSFLVCINGSPMYHGAFWTWISSVSFTGPAIILPKLSPYVIRVTKNYPPALEDTELDVRDNADVKKILQLAGKLL